MTAGHTGDGEGPTLPRPEAAVGPSCVPSMTFYWFCTFVPNVPSLPVRGKGQVDSGVGEFIVNAQDTGRAGKNRGRQWDGSPAFLWPLGRRGPVSCL